MLYYWVNVILDYYSFFTSIASGQVGPGPGQSAPVVPSPCQWACIYKIALLTSLRPALVQKWVSPCMHAFIFEINVYQESGWQFNTADGLQWYTATITIISADNPASSAIGGFKESASAYRPCRHCLGTANEIRQEVLELMCNECIDLVTML